MHEPIKLTNYSKGAGCGCKIAPKILDDILKGNITSVHSNNLLVGNETKDDAAVISIEGNTAIISTTDFFMPVVDDAFSFGKIAAANAISDVYAMGGKPLLAIAILGWPVEKLPVELAQQVLDGARDICNEAGISLAGGHSIDANDPFFGLAVTGIANVGQLKKNSGAKENDILFVTKPIGVGILSTAQKRNAINKSDADLMIKQMAALNKIGEKIGRIAGVNAMTDITGFGILGHLIEMCEGSNVAADLYYNNIPIIESARTYLQQRLVPDATYRNWNSYSNKVSFDKNVNVMEAFNILPDPQTNGGLLFSVSVDAVELVVQLLKENNLDNFTTPVGRIKKLDGEKIINVITV